MENETKERFIVRCALQYQCIESKEDIIRTVTEKLKYNQFEINTVGYIYCREALHFLLVDKMISFFNIDDLLIDTKKYIMNKLLQIIYLESDQS